MKKVNILVSALVLSAHVIQAKPVKLTVAKQVAQNFYSLNNKIDITSVNLAYTGLTASGTVAYFAFNVNTKDGFVIVSADDVASPIIGYATQNNFVTPDPSTTIGHWLAIRAKEVENIQHLNLLPSAQVALSWVKYQTNNPAILQRRTNGINSTMTAAVAPLVQSTWNQSPNYNAMCPGGSVTGCVATAMAQIMRFWNYPATGNGASSYCDCSAQNFSNNYGTLSANYGATTYNWANMPLALTGHNNDVAILNYHCGVSVDMDYDPAGSGAWVIASDDPICAQNSYVNYFKYDPTTIQGLNRSDFNDTTWMNLLKHDINIGRPIQYVGDDPAEGGHTWVCDGYDQNDFLHMNWGWGGSNNGYFFINNLQTTNGTFNPSVGHQAIIGIVPIASVALDAGVSQINAPDGFYCSTNFSPVIKLKNYGSTTLTTCDIYYKIDNGSLQTQNWSGSLVTGQSAIISLPAFIATTGSHTLTCYSSNPNTSTDANMANNQSTVTFNVTLPGVLPIVESFENNVVPNANWSTSHTTQNGAGWAVTANGAATGSNSCFIDNSANLAGNGSFLQTISSYNLSSFTNPTLSFKVAYQKKASTNNDKLQVFTSTDCGNSWQSRWSRWSSTLATLSGTSTGAFVPTPAEFTTYTVNINAVAANTSVLFRWEFVADANGAGNNLYMDDINIVDAPSVTAIQNLETKVSLNLYPNPSTGKTNIAFNLTEKHSIAIQVTDMIGRLVENVEAKLYQQGESNYVIGNDNSYQPGIYLVNINIDGQHISKKVIVQ